MLENNWIEAVAYYWGFLLATHCARVCRLLRPIAERHELFMSVCTACRCLSSLDLSMTRCGVCNQVALKVSRWNYCYVASLSISGVAPNPLTPDFDRDCT